LPINTRRQETLPVQEPTNWRNFNYSQTPRHQGKFVSENLQGSQYSGYSQEQIINTLPNTAYSKQGKLLIQDKIAGALSPASR
jgi:hypothetical protein